MTVAARDPGELPASTASGRPGDLTWALLAGTIALGAALRFLRIGHQTFWHDETVTIAYLHLPLATMLRTMPRTESTPPLYYVLAWLWARSFGFGEAGVRSLSALAGVATIPALYGAAAKLVSRRAGIVAAALTACSPLLIWYSQEARSYALLMLFGALSLCAFAYARARPTGWALAAWSVTSALALATHYYAVLLVAPEALWLLASRPRARAVQLAAAAVTACGGALVPLVLRERTNAPWIGLIPLGRRLAQVPRQFMLGTGAPAAGLLLAFGGVAVAVAVLLIARRGDARARSGTGVAAGLLAGGAALNAALLVAGIDNLITRNVMVLWLPLVVVIAAGFASPHARWIGAAGAAVVAAIGIVAVVGVALDSALQRPDWRAVAHALGPWPPPGSRGARAILIQRNLVEFWLYMPGVRLVGRGGAVVDEFDVVASDTRHDAACWWGAACMLVPSALPHSLPLTGFRSRGRVRHVEQFDLLRLASAHPVRITPSVVARALTTTRLAQDMLFVQRPPP